MSSTEQAQIKELVLKYSDVFAENPKKPKATITEHRIITENAMPVHQKPRRIPLAWENEVHVQLQEMLDNDIIRPSTSPWNSPIILVKKKDNTMRFVCDFRSLNDSTKKDTYPLPHLRDVIDKMHGAKYWTTLDAASAYWSMPLAEEDKEKTAFSVPRGKFEFNVTPYGLCNAGASYQRMMDVTLSGLPPDQALAFMDDTAIYSKTFEEHLDNIESVFTRLRQSGVTLRLAKCVFASPQVDFLGYELSERGVKPQKRLTTAINEFHRPSSKKELKRFLGMAGFYRGFIANFSAISYPLNQLTRENVSFTWTEETEGAFQQLKHALSSKPVLAFPQSGEQFTVEVDASDYAAGGVLSQYDEHHNLRPVAYYSTAFTKNQQKWSPHSKEAFALLLATRHWHVYLAGVRFTLKSDHNPLVHLREQKDPRGKFARWISELEEYNYTVEYIPGAANVKADAFSRNAGAELNQPPCFLDDHIYTIQADFLEQLRAEQDSDPVIGPAKQCVAVGGQIIQGRLKRVRKQLRIENDVLTKAGRPVVPPSLRKSVVSDMHESTHPGVDKLYAQLQQRFYWPNMYEYAKIFVSYCSTCNQCKADNKPPKAPLEPLFIPEAPMQFVSIDIAHLPTDDGNYKYVLLMGDTFSKYIETVPLQIQTATTVVDAFMDNWVMRHGTPLYLLSDQGTNVDSETMKELCNISGIEKR